MIAILLFGAAVIAGSVLADRVLAGGRSAHPAAVQDTVALGRLIGLPIVLLLGVLVLFRLYTSTYALALAVFAAVVAVAGGYLVQRRSGSVWVYVSHALPAALAVGLLGTEALLAAAAAGGFPARYPSAWSFVADARAIPAIAGGLHHPDPVVRLSAVNELGNGMTREGTHYLCAVVEDPYLSVRGQALAFLSRTADESCIPALEKATLDTDYAARQSALTALILTKSHRAYLAIVRAQVAHDRAVNAAVQKDPRNGRRMLGNSTPGYSDADMANSFRNQSAARDYLPRLAKEGSGAPDDADVRAEALLLLGQVGDGTALPVLISQAHSENPVLRGNAATGLAQLAARSRVEQARDWMGIWQSGIVAVSDSPPPLGIDSRTIERELLRLLRDPDEGVRSRAAEGLMRILRRNYMWGGRALDTFDPDSRMQSLDGPEVRSAVVQSLHDPSPQVRSRVVEIMGEIGDHRAIPLLLEADKTSRSPNGCEYCGLLRDLGVTKLAHAPAPSTLNEF